MITASESSSVIEEQGVKHPGASRVFAHIVSFLLHPLFLPVYISAFIMFVHPSLFAGYDEGRKIKLLATVFVNLTLLPAVTVFLCWRLGFVSGMFLKTQKERIIPLAAAMIFYFWCWFVLRNFTAIPEIFRDFLLGSFLTIIAAWLANISFKVSLHGLSAGGMLSFAFILLYTGEGGSAWYLALAVILAAAICTARLILSTHRPFEIYMGLVIGMICQVVAVFV